MKGGVGLTDRAGWTVPRDVIRPVQASLLTSSRRAAVPLAQGHVYWRGSYRPRDRRRRRWPASVATGVWCEVCRPRASRRRRPASPAAAVVLETQPGDALRPPSHHSCLNLPSAPSQRTDWLAYTYPALSPCAAPGLLLLCCRCLRFPSCSSSHLFFPHHPTPPILLSPAQRTDIRISACLSLLLPILYFSNLPRFETSSTELFFQLLWARRSSFCIPSSSLSRLRQPPVLLSARVVCPAVRWAVSLEHAVRRPRRLEPMQNGDRQVSVVITAWLGV